MRPRPTMRQTSLQPERSPEREGRRLAQRMELPNWIGVGSDAFSRPRVSSPGRSFAIKLYFRELAWCSDGTRHR